MAQIDFNQLLLDLDGNKIPILPLTMKAADIAQLDPVESEKYQPGPVGYTLKDEFVEYATLRKICVKALQVYLEDDQRLTYTQRNDLYELCIAIHKSGKSLEVKADKVEVLKTRISKALANLVLAGAAMAALEASKSATLVEPDEEAKEQPAES